MTIVITDIGLIIDEVMADKKLIIFDFDGIIITSEFCFIDVFGNPQVRSRENFIDPDFFIAIIRVLSQKQIPFIIASNGSYEHISEHLNQIFTGMSRELKYTYNGNRIFAPLVNPFNRKNVFTPRNIGFPERTVCPPMIPHPKPSVKRNIDNEEKEEGVIPTWIESNKNILLTYILRTHYPKVSRTECLFIDDNIDNCYGAEFFLQMKTIYSVDNSFTCANQPHLREMYRLSLDRIKDNQTMIRDGYQDFIHIQHRQAFMDFSILSIISLIDAGYHDFRRINYWLYAKKIPQPIDEFKTTKIKGIENSIAHLNSSRVARNIETGEIEPFVFEQCMSQEPWFGHVLHIYEENQGWFEISRTTWNSERTQNYIRLLDITRVVDKESYKNAIIVDYDGQTKPSTLDELHLRKIRRILQLGYLWINQTKMTLFVSNGLDKYFEKDSVRWPYPYAIYHSGRNTHLFSLTDSIKDMENTIYWMENTGIPKVLGYR